MSAYPEEARPNGLWAAAGAACPDGAERATVAGDGVGGGGGVGRRRIVLGCSARASATQLRSQQTEVS